jgi:hypothetical protein
LHLGGFRLELFEQRAQRDRRPFAAVAHDRDERIVLAVDFPGGDLAPWRTKLAARPAFAALAFLAAPPARPGFPIGAGTNAGIVLACNEPGRIKRNNVKRLVSFVCIVGVANYE